MMTFEKKCHTHTHDCLDDDDDGTKKNKKIKITMPCHSQWSI